MVIFLHRRPKASCGFGEKGLGLQQSTTSMHDRNGYRVIKRVII